MKSNMPKHGKKFALAYIKNDRNASAAAATLKGISKKSAGEIGSRLLKNVEVRTEINRLQIELEERTLIDKTRVLHELGIVAFSDIRDFVEVVEGGVVLMKPWVELPPGVSRAASSVKEQRSIRADNESDGDETIIDVKTEFKLHDKLEALKQIANINGYNSKLEVEHSGNVSVEVIDYTNAVPKKEGN